MACGVGGNRKGNLYVIGGKGNINGEVGRMDLLTGEGAEGKSALGDRFPANAGWVSWRFLEVMNY
jgi:hypothetical protein